MNSSADSKTGINRNEVQILKQTESKLHMMENCINTTTLPLHILDVLWMMYGETFYDRQKSVPLRAVVICRLIIFRGRARYNLNLLPVTYSNKVVYWFIYWSLTTDRSKAVVLLWFSVVRFWYHSFSDVSPYECSVWVAEWSPYHMFSFHFDCL